MTPTTRTRVVRVPQRGVYDRATIDHILDESLVCHFGFVMEGQPYVIPMMYARAGDLLYVHGSAASRLIRHAGSGVPACVTVTLVDGVVLARSVFHHSMNYRSVVALGVATLVEGATEKLDAIRAFTEKIVPGRWGEARPPTEHELRATSIVQFPLTEVSAKIRSGPVKDDEADYDLPVWAGVIPLVLTAGVPVRDARCTIEMPAPQLPGPVARQA